MDFSSHRARRTAILIFLDQLWVQISLIGAYFVAYDLQLPKPLGTLLLNAGIPTAIAALVIAKVRGIYRIRARYMGLYDFLNLGVVGLIMGLFVALLAWSSEEVPSSLSVATTFPFFLGLGWTGSRVILRLYSWRQFPRSLVPGSEPRIRTIIVGAGDAGEMVIRELQKLPNQHRVINGMVDDDPEKRSLMIQGIRVLGSIDELPRIASTLEIDELIIAVPSADGAAMRRIIGICHETKARVRTLPSVAKLLTSSVDLQYSLRDVDIEDLLRREPARADMAKVAAYVRGESILVTGGGGSIGGELSRQMAQLHPTNLVLLGKGENSLYEVEQEIVQSSHLHPYPVVADVRSQRSLEYAFNRYQPSIVFHAAAHKHVPLMQSNPIEAIENNVFGTLYTAEAAVRHGAKRFVYISTDKAVHPTSVMGATKRVGEMIVNALAHRSETSFAIVRFGNVLGSRGSLIPLLKSQIARGGPVRITHPDMTRYFMTIPEAVQLVMHAGASGGNGELFILDMGEPVKILDLATDLIRLHGFEPHRDIPIKFIGIRPGEKTHEELVYEQENLLPTDHEKIKMVASRPIDWDWLKRELDLLKSYCDQGDQEKARQFLMELANGKTALGVVQMNAPTEQESINPAER